MGEAEVSRFLCILIKMGEALQNSGAEVFRVEDTLNRIGSRIRRAGGQCIRHHIQHRCHPDNAAAPAADPDTPSAPCVRE